MSDAVANERAVVVGVGGPLRRVGPRARREHDDVGVGLRRGDLGAEPQLDARPLQRPGRVRVPAPPTAPRARARGRRAAAGRRRPRRARPAPRRRRAHPRAARPPPRRGRRRSRARAGAVGSRAARQRPLAARPRVDVAGDREPGVVVADAALVAADAADHLVGSAPCAALRTSSGSAISARVMPDQVGGAVGDELLGVGEVRPRASCRAAARSTAARAARSGSAIAALGGRRRRHDPARRRVAYAESPSATIDEVDQPVGAERARDLGAGVGVEPAGATPRRRTAARRRRAPARRRRGSPRAPRGRSAAGRRARRCSRRRGGWSAARRTARPGRRAPSRARCRRPRPRAPCTAQARKPSTQLARSRARVSARGSHVEALRRHRGRRDGGRARRGGDLLPPAVEELDEQPRPVRRGPCRRAAGSRGRSPAGSRRCVCDVSRPVGCTAVASRKIAPTPPRGARLLVGDQVLGRHVLVHEARLVRRRDDPVAQRDGPERDRREQLHRRTVPLRPRAAPACPGS